MAKETKAQMQARHDREMGDRMARDSATVAKALDRAEKDADRADRIFARLQDADRALEKMRDELAQQKAVYASLRAEISDRRGERDLLRGFIFREIPIRLADLPGPIASALGVVQGDSV